MNRTSEPWSPIHLALYMATSLAAGFLLSSARKDYLPTSWLKELTGSQDAASQLEGLLTAANLLLVTVVAYVWATFAASRRTTSFRLLTAVGWLAYGAYLWLRFTPEMNPFATPTNASLVSFATDLAFFAGGMALVLQSRRWDANHHRYPVFLPQLLLVGITAVAMGSLWAAGLLPGKYLPPTVSACLLILTWSAYDEILGSIPMPDVRRFLNISIWLGAAMQFPAASAVKLGGGILVAGIGLKAVLFLGQFHLKRIEDDRWGDNDEFFVTKTRKPRFAVKLASVFVYPAFVVVAVYATIQEAQSGSLVMATAGAGLVLWALWAGTRHLRQTSDSPRA